MADTSKDVRILAMERLITRLLGMVQQRAYGSAKQTAKAREILNTVASRVAALRYSYLEDDALAAADDTRAVADGVKLAVESLRGNRETSPERRSFLEFVGDIAGHFPGSFNGNRSLESLVPVQVGRVQAVEAAKGARNLLLCRVDVFARILTLVTNLKDTRAGDRMKVARVPPSTVMGIFSEAQFVGKADKSARPGSRPEISEEEAQEIRRAMGGLLDE